jgi:hypothetical protein
MTCANLVLVSPEIDHSPVTVDWINLDQNRVKFLVVFKMITDFQLPLNTGKNLNKVSNYQRLKKAIAGRWTALHATGVLRAGRSAGAVQCSMVPHTMYPEHTKAYVSGSPSWYSRTTECICLAVTRPILQLGHARIIKSGWIHTSADGWCWRWEHAAATPREGTC